MSRFEPTNTLVTFYKHIHTQYTARFYTTATRTCVWAHMLQVKRRRRRRRSRSIFSPLRDHVCRPWMFPICFWWYRVRSSPASSTWRALQLPDVFVLVFARQTKLYCWSLLINGDYIPAACLVGWRRCGDAVAFSVTIISCLHDINSWFQFRPRSHYTN